MDTINLTGWRIDDRFSPYPEGSRSKYAIFAPPSPVEPCIVPNHRYLMKFSNSRYPVQFWSEIIAWKIGEFVGVTVPPCFYAEDQETGLPGSLIEWFYGEQVEGSMPEPDVQIPPEEFGNLPSIIPLNHSLYVPGSNYMQRQIPEYDMKTGRQHNLRTISFLLTRFRQRWALDFWPTWAKMLVFDALIGNTDRHQDNWGVLWRAGVPRFAPAFDNGTSLLHEIQEQNLKKFDDEAALDRYILRGRHHVRWEIDDPKPLGHLELVQKLIQKRPALLEIIFNMLSFDRQELYTRLMTLCDFDVKIPISETRMLLIFRLLDRRANLILKCLNNE